MSKAKIFIYIWIFLFAFITKAQIKMEAVFNTPGFSGNKTNDIEDKLVEMTRKAVAGSQIRIAMYTLERVPLVNELVLASQRGVDVQLVLDGGNAAFAKTDGHAINILVNGLNCNLENQQGCIKFCDGPLSGILAPFKLKKDYPLGRSCRGVGTNHNKFFLFTELSDGSRDIIAQTSASLSDGQLRLYNDLLIIKNDVVLFNGLVDYWHKLKGDRTVLKKSFPTLISDESSAKAYFFPRKFSNDPVLVLLSKVRCHLPGSSIRVLQSSFSLVYLANQMKKLASQGCALQVVARIDPRQRSLPDEVKSALGEHLTILPFRGKKSHEKSFNSIHSKVILINASIDDSPEKTAVVLTGSLNLDYVSVNHNDETLFEIRNLELFKKYDNYMDQILSDAEAAGVKTIPNDAPKVFQKYGNRP